MYRDFSTKSKLNILNLVTQVENEKMNDFTDWVGDRWFDFESWIGKLSIQNYITNINKYHKMVIDKNNATRNTIEYIFNRVKTVDNKNALTFSMKRTQLQLCQNFVNELCDIISPQKGNFTGEYMKSKLDVILTDITRIDALLFNMQNGKIIEFDFTSYILGNRNSAFDGIAVAWTSDWIQNFRSLFKIADNVNETAVRKSIEAIIKESLTHKHEASDFFDNYTEALTSDVLNNAKKIIDLFLKTGKTYTEIEIVQILNMKPSEIEESDYLKLLCQQENQLFINKMSTMWENSIGAYFDAVKTLDISAEMITKVFNNYVEDTKYLEAIKQALLDGGYDNKTVNEVVDSMLWEYRNQYFSAAHDGIEKLVNMGIDKGIDKLIDVFNKLTKTTVVSEVKLAVDLFLGGKDITSSIIGLSDKTDDVSAVYATQQYSCALVDKYEFYRAKITSGNFTRDDVEKYNTYLTLAKSAKLHEYNAIKSITQDALNSVNAFFRSDDDKEYTRILLAQIEAEIQRLESM